MKVADYVQSLENSCRRCGMVLPKVVTVRPSYPTDEQNFIKGFQPAMKVNVENSTRCHCHAEANETLEKADGSSVKSRVSFFENNMFTKPKLGHQRKLRQAKSMTNLLDAATFFEKAEEVPIVFEPKQLPVVEAPPKQSGCPFSGKRELKNVRLKNYVSSTQQNDILHMKAQVRLNCS